MDKQKLERLDAGLKRVLSRADAVIEGSKRDLGFKREAKFHVDAGHTRQQVIDYPQHKDNKAVILKHYDRMTKPVNRWR